MKTYPPFTYQGLSVAVPFCFAAMIALAATHAGAQIPVQGAREVPAKTVPVPDTVSPQMQKLIAAPLSATWNVIPKTADEWKAQVDRRCRRHHARAPALRATLRVKVEPITIDGVKVHMVAPEAIPPENRNRLLVHLHGGCFVSFPVNPELSKRFTWRASDTSK